MQEGEKMTLKNVKTSVDIFPDVSKIIIFSSGQSLRSAVFFSFQLISCIPRILLLFPVNARNYSCAICKHVPFLTPQCNPTMEFISQVHDFLSHRWIGQTILSISHWLYNSLFFHSCKNTGIENCWKCSPIPEQFLTGDVVSNTGWQIAQATQIRIILQNC